MSILAAIIISLPILVAILIYILLPYTFHRRRFYQLMKKIPGPDGVPYFGNAFYFFGPHEELLPKMVNMYKQYGSIVKFSVLGNYQVLISDIEDIESLLNNMQHIDKSDDYLFLNPWLGTGLLTSTGKKWHSHRKILTPAFHFKILESYISVFNKNSEKFVNKLMTLSSDNDYLEINSLVSLCTLDMICETAMGVSINALDNKENEYVQAVKRMSHLFQHRQICPYLWRPFLFAISPSGREQERVLNILHGFTNKLISNLLAYAIARAYLAVWVIKDRRSEYRATVKSQMENVKKTKRLAFLDLLIEVAEKDGSLTDVEIREEVDTFMFEGHDTTSQNISWTLHLLGRNPAVQDKLYEELQDIFGDSDREATFDDLQNMKYLEQVIKESLRLYPSVPLFGRKIEEEINIKNYILPSGSAVYVPPFLIHRDAKLFPNPDKFDPERFSPENSIGRHPYSYLPFSAGPRNCIGQRFALLEEKAVLSRIVRNFVLQSLDKPQDIKLMIELVLRPKDELRIKFTPRNTTKQ